MAKKLTEQEEEQKWLESVQKKLIKYISSPYWDSLHLSDSYLSIISQLVNTKDVRKLSAGINERVTDILIEKIEKELKKAKQSDKTKNY